MAGTDNTGKTQNSLPPGYGYEFRKFAVSKTPTQTSEQEVNEDNTPYMGDQAGREIPLPDPPGTKYPPPTTAAERAGEEKAVYGDEKRGGRVKRKRKKRKGAVIEGKVAHRRLDRSSKAKVRAAKAR